MYFYLDLLFCCSFQSLSHTGPGLLSQIDQNTYCHLLKERLTNRAFSSGPCYLFDLLCEGSFIHHTLPSRHSHCKFTLQIVAVLSPTTLPFCLELPSFLHLISKLLPFFSFCCQTSFLSITSSSFRTSVSDTFR